MKPSPPRTGAARRGCEPAAKELTNRPDAIDETTPEPSAFDRLVAPSMYGDYFDSTVDNSPELDQDIER